MFGLWEWDLDFDPYLLLFLFLWGLTLAIGANRAWRWLVDPPRQLWPIYFLSFVNRFFGTGAVLIFINFLALRQAVTPQPLLGRMTSTMRWLILIPAGPGALLGGWLGEHIGLRAALAFAGGAAALLALLAWRHPVIRGVKVLPKAESADEWVGAEAEVRPLSAMGSAMDAT